MEEENGAGKKLRSLKILSASEGSVGMIDDQKERLEKEGMKSSSLRSPVSEH